MIQSSVIYPVFLPQLGCAHRCYFCNQQLSSGVERPQLPEELPSRLEPMVADRPGGEVAFYGGSFTALPTPMQDAYLTAIAPLLESGRIGGVRLSTRPDAFDDNRGRFLADYGVTTVEFGVQSFDDQVLQRSGRGHGADAACKAIAAAKASGFRVGVQLMPGLPGGDDAEAVLSLRMAAECGADFVRIFPAVALRDTPFATMVAKGEIELWPLCRAVRVGADLLEVARNLGLPVIRLGLQQGELMDVAGAVVAGPHHPAFGELVYAEIWRRGLAAILNVGGDHAVEVHPADRSRLSGYRRGNLSWLAIRQIRLYIHEDSTLPRDVLRYGGDDWSVYTRGNSPQKHGVT